MVGRSRARKKFRQVGKPSLLSWCSWPGAECKSFRKQAAKRRKRCLDAAVASPRCVQRHPCESMPRACMLALPQVFSLPFFSTSRSVRVRQSRGVVPSFFPCWLVESDPGMSAPVGTRSCGWGWTEIFRLFQTSAGCETWGNSEIPINPSSQRTVSWYQVPRSLGQISSSPWLHLR